MCWKVLNNVLVAWASLHGAGAVGRRAEEPGGACRVGGRCYAGTQYALRQICSASNDAMKRQVRYRPGARGWVLRKSRETEAHGLGASKGGGGLHFGNPCKLPQSKLLVTYLHPHMHLYAIQMLCAPGYVENVTGFLRADWDYGAADGRPRAPGAFVPLLS